MKGTWLHRQIMTQAQHVNPSCEHRFTKSRVSRLFFLPWCSLSNSRSSSHLLAWSFWHKSVSFHVRISSVKLGSRPRGPRESPYLEGNKPVHASVDAFTFSHYILSWMKQHGGDIYILEKSVVRTSFTWDGSWWSQTLLEGSLRTVWILKEHLTDE